MNISLSPECVAFILEATRASSKVAVEEVRRSMKDAYCEQINRAQAAENKIHLLELRLQDTQDQLDAAKITIDSLKGLLLTFRGVDDNDNKSEAVEEEE